MVECTDRESKEDVSDHKSEELFRSLVTCGICLQLYVDPVALLNCLHLACGACAKEWLKSSKSCHECRGPVRGVHDSHYALAVVEAYHSVAPNSSLCQERTPEVVAALREQYKPGQKLTIGEESEESSDESSSDSSESENEDNESPEEESHYRELRLHNDSCPFCDRAGGSGDEFICPVPCTRPADDVGSRTLPAGHTICSECHRFLPTRSDLLRSYCAVCTRTTCSEFGKSCLPNLTAVEVRVELGLGILRDADFLGGYELPLTHAFGDNEFERDIFRTWATNTDFSLQDLFREILAFRGSSLPKASWHGNANEAIGLPYVNVDDKVCTSCILDLVEASLFEWWISKRQSGAIELPEDVTARADCWYGIECRTARHNHRHAMNYNHICRKTAIDQQTESHDSPENGNRYVAYSGDLNTTFPAFNPSAIIFRDKGKELSFMCSSVRGTESSADIIPGKATVWGFGYGVYVYYGEEGQEHLQDGSVQLLIDTTGMHWVPASCGEVPEGCRPVVGGRRVSAGRTLELHHCAVWWYGQRVPGYVCKEHGYAAITWGGQEWYFKDNYELLCWK